MRISCLTFAAVLCAALSVPAMAQNNPSQGGGAPGGGAAPSGGGQQAGGSSTTPSDAIKLDPTPFFNEVDTNHDNKVSKEEWKAAGLPDSVYTMFDKDSKGYISKEAMADKGHPPTMDSDKSGKLTLAKLKAHIAKQGGGGGGQQGGGAPAGGQQGGGAPQSGGEQPK
jgi:hypothetical protein